MPKITIDIPESDYEWFRSQADYHGANVRQLVQRTLLNAVDGCVRESTENSMRDALWLAARQVPLRSK